MPPWRFVRSDYPRFASGIRSDTLLLSSMGLIVQKYGGTSVGTTERIRNVARRVARFHRERRPAGVLRGGIWPRAGRRYGCARWCRPMCPRTSERSIPWTIGEACHSGLRMRTADNQSERNAKVALVPPKPKELDSAARIFMARATFGTKSRSHLGSRWNRFAVGGAI